MNDYSQTATMSNEAMRALQHEKLNVVLRLDEENNVWNLLAKGEDMNAMLNTLMGQMPGEIVWIAMHEDILPQGTEHYAVKMNKVMLTDDCINAPHNDDTTIKGRIESVSPRRNRLDLMLPAELAIVNAVDNVERLGADVGLTDAVNQLAAARSKVSDYVDEHPELLEKFKERSASTICKVFETPLMQVVIMKESKLHEDDEKDEYNIVQIAQYDGVRLSVAAIFHDMQERDEKFAAYNYTQANAYAHTSFETIMNMDAED